MTSSTARVMSNPIGSLFSTEREGPGKLEEFRYRAQQRSLALGFGVVMRGFHFVMAPSMRPPAMKDILTLDARFEALLQRDLQNVREGFYPKELLLKLPVGEYARVLPNAVVELPRIWMRARRRAFDELPTGIKREHYPPYYLRTFHWQTDGWLSERSARLYDVGVDLLFGGATDVMRRMAIPPLVRALKGERRPRILDVACGTARFLTQLHAALPDAKLYGLDLSHPYLRQAARNLSGIPDVSLVCDRAEQMPFETGHFDAVSSIFLFHELPRDARRQVMKEMFRVLKPGGTLVITDSVQLGDSEEIQHFLDAFHTIYHEPYYKSYLRDPLSDGLREVGFDVEDEDVFFVSKGVTARKPR